MNPGWSKVESVTEAPVQPLTKEKKTTMFEIKEHTDGTYRVIETLGKFLMIYAGFP